MPDRDRDRRLVALCRSAGGEKAGQAQAAGRTPPIPGGASLAQLDPLLGAPSPRPATPSAPSCLSSPILPLRAHPSEPSLTPPFSVLESLLCGVWPIATLCHFAAPLWYCLSLGGHGGEAGMTCHHRPIYGSPGKAGWGLRVLSCWSGSKPR